MPINGLSEITRMPRIAKIHLGEKVQKGNTTYPKATDYFVLPSKDDVGELADILRATLGDKPKELPVIFPVDNDEEFASQYYRCYGKTRGLVCRGDGIKATCKIDTTTGAMITRDTKPENVVLKEITCAGKECPYYQDKQCREMMMLQFMLPDIPGIGIWQIDTSSINSIININSSIKMYRGIFGKVAMLPLTLTLKPQEVLSPVDQKKKTVHVLNLEVRQSLRDMLAIAEKTPLERLALPAADDEKPEIVEDAVETTTTAVKPDMPQAEEDTKNYWPEGDGGPPPAAQKTDTPAQKGEQPMRNLGDLFRACKAFYQLMPDQVCKELGVSGKESISDVADAWEKIKAIKAGG